MPCQNDMIRTKVQWFTINQDGIEEELQTNDGLTSIKAENAALKYRCKIDENTYADFVVRKGDLFFVKALRKGLDTVESLSAGAA